MIWLQVCCPTLLSHCSEILTFVSKVLSSFVTSLITDCFHLFPIALVFISASSFATCWIGLSCSALAFCPRLCFLPRFALFIQPLSDSSFLFSRVSFGESLFEFLIHSYPRFALFFASVGVDYFKRIL